MAQQALPRGPRTAVMIAGAIVNYCFDLRPEKVICASRNSTGHPKGRAVRV